MSYRFRIEEEIPQAPPVQADLFSALTSASPLAEWIRYYDGQGRVPARDALIMQQVEARPGELARLLHTDDDEVYGRAMLIVQQMKGSDPVIVSAMQEVAAETKDQIRKLNKMNPEDPGYVEFGTKIARHIHFWWSPWEMVQARAGINGRPLVEEILKLAQESHNSQAMGSVVEDAKTLLGYLAAGHKQ